MKVRCIDNKGKWLPEKVFSFYNNDNDLEFTEVELGKEYIVYAISYNLGHPFYMVCGDDYDGKYVNYPHLLPGCLFEIVDNTPSTFWIEKEIKNDKSRYMNTKKIGFKEFVKNKYFHGNLLEAYKKEVKQFALAKELIDKEYST